VTSYTHSILIHLLHYLRLGNYPNWINWCYQEFERCWNNKMVALKIHCYKQYVKPFDVKWKFKR
jgi:hypothetical protein